ncbi:hypothetical protein P4H42_32200 [Paenibacillus macerans]|uniref:hypothetical protein n=1 Tax=Paenibacillus macerans TaxID=44252 RepID=UPI002DB7CD1C|nr:hypothetical protein [Paenibacillus macerans]MEC0334230.1 hypothetical protein [Paenibacillus macerans]
MKVVKREIREIRESRESRESRGNRRSTGAFLRELPIRRKFNGCNSRYFTKKGGFQFLTVVSIAISLNPGKDSRVSVK